VGHRRYGRNPWNRVFAVEQSPGDKPTHVIGALVIQVAFAVIVLYWDLGRRVLEVLTKGVQAIVDSSSAGIDFLFGPILPGPGSGPIFAFQVLPK
jgi:concentrative nucleoside transporter, CNT family